MAINTEKLRSYINGFYKPNFRAISKNEIYKWDALRNFNRIHFLDGWFDESELFCSRFTEAVNSLENLLNGHQFYAKGLLIDCARSFPLETKKALLDLNYAGLSNKNAIEAMDSFQNVMVALTRRLKKPEYYIKSFSGYRAAALLLFFMYPSKYFFYKNKEYGLIKDKIDYEAIPNITDYENCQKMSGEILEYIRTDEELSTCYEERRNLYNGIDPSYHLLVQDILWSARYYDDSKPNGGTVEATEGTGLIVFDEIASPRFRRSRTENKPVLGIDYEGEQRRNTELGLEGEYFVMRVEEERLKRLFPEDITKRPKHVSIIEGDGAGYDILSFDERGERLYIEVKTTTGNYNTPFYVTNHELTQSIGFPDQYCLYRVYHFKDGSGDIGFTRGSLEKYCKDAVTYKIILEK